MSSRKSPISALRYEQPYIGFVASFRTERIKKSGSSPRRATRRRKKQPSVESREIHLYNDCREGLVWDLKEIFQDFAVEWERESETSWHRTPVLSHTLDTEDKTLKRPGKTYLFAGGEEEYPSPDHCIRPCCIEERIETLDALVGPLAVLLNNDRYIGNWWTTSPEESTKAREEIRWYGTDNFFLRHPTLLSLMMGMFRQGLLLFQQNFSGGLLKAISREDVEDCLTNADPALAMRILTTLRPWVEVPCNFHVGVHYPFPRGYWPQLRLLHRAIYKHGYDEVFGMGMEKSWKLGVQGRYEIPNGPRIYWGRSASRQNEAARRLAKLGK